LTGSWKGSEISPELIVKSFKHCSINPDLYGSENSLVNSKLLVKQDIQNYLQETFKKRSVNPCSDLKEVDDTILSTSDVISYD